MLITLYTPVGIIYQKFTINEHDITYGDLLKYINLPKNNLYDELDESRNIYDKVFVKTIINLFSYNQINLDDEINGDINEFTILFSYEYYIYDYRGNKYKKIENKIKNYDDIFEEIKNDPYQIIFIDCNDKNYEEICKLAVKHIYNSLQYIKEQTDEICKLAVQKNGYELKYVKEQTDEICKLAVQQNSYAFEYVKEQTDEICKFAVQQNGYLLYYVKEQTDEICKLAVKQNGCSLCYVKEQTDEICKLAVQQNGCSLCYVKEQTDEICKLAIQQDGYALKYVKDQTDEICKLALEQNCGAFVYVKEEFRTPELLKFLKLININTLDYFL